MANIMVFDTETAGGFNKPFAYNIGYTIKDTESGETLTKKDYVVEQVWHNLPLFTSAYYANKRELYVSRMRGKRTKMLKFGYICQEMIRDIERHEVTSAYAYNSPFDDNVFNTNCDWYKCVNPFDNIPIFDIRGYVHEFLVNGDFKNFCELNSYFTEGGNYSTTAETVYRFITDNTDFSEEHTALADSEIEWEILNYCLTYFGAELETAYKVQQSIKREVDKKMKIFIDRQPTAEITYRSKTIKGDNIYFRTK